MRYVVVILLLLFVGCNFKSDLIYTWNGVKYDLSQEQIEGYNLPTIYTIKTATYTSSNFVNITIGLV